MLSYFCQGISDSQQPPQRLRAFQAHKGSRVYKDQTDPMDQMVQIHHSAHLQRQLAVEVEAQHLLRLVQQVVQEVGVEILLQHQAGLELLDKAMQVAQAHLG